MDYLAQLERSRYGSLELQRHTGANLVRGFGISVFVHGFLISAPFVIGLVMPPTPPTDDTVKAGPTIFLPSSRSALEKIVPVLEKPIGKPPVDAVPLPTEHEELVDTLLPDTKSLAGNLGEAGDATEAGVSFDSLVSGVVNSEEIPEDKGFYLMEVEPVALDDNPLPKYPDLALRAGVQGKVWVRLFINRNGSVKQFRIEKADPAGLGFEEEVEKVVLKWKFTPAIQQGNPIPVWVSCPLKFSIRN